MIHRRHEIFTFDPADVLPEKNSLTFQIELDFSTLTSDCVLAEIPGRFILRRRTAKGGFSAQQSYTKFWCETCLDRKYDEAQHYMAHPMPDGTVPVIEAILFLQNDDPAEWKAPRNEVAFQEWTEIRTGFAQSRTTQDKHTLTVHCDGVRFHLLLDGELRDENFIYGSIVPATGELITSAQNVRYDSPGLNPHVTVEYRTTQDSVQYFTPHGDNAWVGDVVPFSHNGTAHLFYLLDRRHHASKFQTGAHYYGHLSSTDLIEWTEHEPIGRIENQWESCGTGTPFYHNGKYYFAYGLHTDRFIPRAENGTAPYIAPDQVKPVSFSELGGRAPEGMTYAVSDDCIHFEKSFKITHFSENPSVYTMPDGSLKMYADGIWRADQVDGIWTCLSSDFPPFGKAATMRNTLECPSFFEWNGYYYVAVGMNGFYGSPTADFAQYDDMAADGRDVYNGLIVPMIFSWNDNRRLISGWIFPFGSFMVTHELVQLENHALGIKWCPELFPAVTAEKTLSTASGVLDDQPSQKACYVLEIDGSKGGRIALQFSGKGAETVEFQLDLDAKTAQFETVEKGQVFAPPLRTMRECVAEYADKIESFKQLPAEVKYKCHVFSRDYKLDRIGGTDGVFTLRIMATQEEKMPSAILDAEIAGIRTMLSLRPDLHLEKVELITDGGALVRSAVKQVLE